MAENENAIEGEIVPAPQTGLSLGSLPVADPTEIVLRATAVAKVLTKVIKDQHLSRNIQGREYVYVTGWSTLGAMLGIMARETPNGTYAREDGSYVGSVDLIRVSDGMVIGGGTAVVGMDEKDRDGKLTWGARPEYARRSMAVTRAAGKAYRLTLAWIMALAGFEGTPAEEMDGLNLQDDDGFSKPKPKATQTAPAPRTAAPAPEAVSSQAETPEWPVRPWNATTVKAWLETMYDGMSDNAKKTAMTAEEHKKLGMAVGSLFPDRATRRVFQFMMFGGDNISIENMSVATGKAYRAWARDAKNAKIEVDNIIATQEFAEIGQAIADGRSELG